MKKHILSVFIAMLALLLGTVVDAASITLLAPVEAEIMPSRDFYVVGKIDRKGIKAQDDPLNVKIELISNSGEVVRVVESNVSVDGLTSASYFLTDYEHGTSYNDTKDTYINEFTPPDIIYNGVDRDSIRLSYNKIVVKEDYFAAIIYGGSSRDVELKYEDKHEVMLEDIEEGEYELKITLSNSMDEEVCTHKQKLNFGSSQERLISSEFISDYANENSLVLPNSIVGYWAPSAYISNASKDFHYVFPQRLMSNLTEEYSESKNVSIFLNNLDVSDKKINMMLGSVFSEESKAEKSYLYYDIGEENIKFSYAGTNLEKKGNVVKTNLSKFIEIIRMETVNSQTNDCFVDFEEEDGVILTKANPSTFYGVYSPVISSVSLLGNEYKISNIVSQIKAVVTNENREICYEITDNVGTIREEGSFNSRYEFDITITPDSKMLESENLTLTFYALDKDGVELFASKGINVKVLEKGKFITNYDESYWGKSYCDSVNIFGQSPSGEALGADEPITRGDFAAMVNRIFGYSLAKEATFSDLDADSIYYNDCATAQHVGYMTGDEKGKVHADDFILREEAIIILARISKAEMAENPIVFADYDKISFWAKDYVDTMSSNGIVSGFDGYLNPTDRITVAEACALIVKTFKWIYGHDTTTEIITVPEGKDLSEIEITDTDYISSITFESLTDFYNNTSDALISLASYVQDNCPDGVFINKVGNGLEVRDYAFGRYVDLSENALNVMNALSAKFAEFSLRYNPASENAVHFIFGRNGDGKLQGITYTSGTEVKNKELTVINGNWYYFIQK